MKFVTAQREMSFSYFGGGPGVLASGIVWSLAGFTAFLASNQVSMFVLFFGGMFIHPLGMLLSKLLKRPGNHNPENPLGKLALESTVIVFVGLFLAFYVAELKTEWFYPVMLLAIGVRYLIFNTLYGSKMYWLLGAILMTSGVSCIVLDANFIVGAFVGGVTEIIFSIIILNQSKGLTLQGIEYD
ncbi:MAG: hypothetical protein ACJAXW_002687 [Candidatus Azotimanducaceae bacterium]|jgi:hypothetical protein